MKVSFGVLFIFFSLSSAPFSNVFLGVFFSLRDNNISDRGICKLIEHALHCEKLQKLA